MPRVELTNVTHRYGGDAALRSVNIAFTDDVTTAIVGRSGSGKSTLLHCINGLVRPGEGTVRVFDAPLDYTDLPATRRRIGWAVQGTGLFPHMTVEGNISLLGRIAGWDGARIRERMATLMRLVELPDAYAGRYPQELSGGEQQRVGLCRAMMLDPPVFLLDEAFGALDSITRSEIHGEFERLQRYAPRTIIMVTHDLREAVRLGQRLAILEEGHLVQHDTVANVIARPATPTVAELIETQLERQ